MKRNIFFACFYLITFIVMIVNAVYLVVGNTVVDINDVPNGDYVFTCASPNGKIELKIYSVNLPIGDAVRVTKTVNGKTENIFWQTKTTQTDVYWLDNEVVSINGIKLEIKKGETFDSRSISSIFNDGFLGWD